MQAKDHARTARRITTLVIASLVIGGCLSQEESKGFSGGNSDNTPTNSAPVISGNPTTDVDVGDLYSFVPTASDADGDSLTFSIENKPTWVSFSSGTGELSGQAALGDVGVYQNIRISATDGADWASLQSFAVSVDQTGTSPPSCDSTPTAYDDENGPPGNGIVIGDLLTRPDTFHSIGFVWDIDGDADHDGSVSVRYRKAGACNFAPAMPLIRNDYEWFWGDERAAEPANNFAGSLMFLTPGTTYEVVLELSDPDGGRAIRVRDLTTRAIPRKPTAGRTLYVVPGNGGGDGSDGNPFRGIDAANAAARPGDRMLLRNGTYARGTLTTSGAEDNHIVYEPDTGHSPVVDAIAVNADHIWIDNLTFTYSGGFTAPAIFDEPWTDTSAIYALPGSIGLDDVIVTNCVITGFENGVIAGNLTNQPISRWVVMDNTIVGPWAAGVGTLPNPIESHGKGVSLGGEGTTGGPDCVLAYNSITRVTDALNANGDSDIYGNQVWDIAGNATAPDGAWENVRIWGNRFHEGAGAPMSLQPQKSGPWYYLYNQMADMPIQIWKFRVQDRSVLINNTFIGARAGSGQAFMRFFMRNNLFIAKTGPIWNSSDGSADPRNIYRVPQYYADWNTDIDYDGFDRGDGGTVFFNWFDNTVSYTTLASWADAVTVGGTQGISAEENGISVDADLIFDNYTTSPTHSLELAAGTNAAVDAGQVVDNLSDFHGSTPDLGAHQRVATPLPYGPRGSGTPLDQQEIYWAKH